MIYKHKNRRDLDNWRVGFYHGLRLVKSLNEEPALLERLLNSVRPNKGEKK